MTSRKEQIRSMFGRPEAVRPVEEKGSAVADVNSVQGTARRARWPAR